MRFRGCIAGTFAVSAIAVAYALVPTTSADFQDNHKGNMTITVTVPPSATPEVPPKHPVHPAHPEHPKHPDKPAKDKGDKDENEAPTQDATPSVEPEPTPIETEVPAPEPMLIEEAVPQLTEPAPADSSASPTTEKEAGSETPVP